jgi:hypothetical protein
MVEHLDNLTERTLTQHVMNLISKLNMVTFHDGIIATLIIVAIVIRRASLVDFDCLISEEKNLRVVKNLTLLIGRQLVVILR